MHLLFFSISKLLADLIPFLQSRAEAQLKQLEKSPSSLGSSSHACTVKSSNFSSVLPGGTITLCVLPGCTRLQALPAVFLLRLSCKDGFNLAAFAQAPFRVGSSHRLPRAPHSFDNFYKSPSVLVIHS